MKLELRSLKASDMGAMCKIISGIGIKEFKDAFKGVNISQKDVEKVGMSVAFDLVGIIIEHIPSVQKDVDMFISSLSDQDVELIQEMPLVEYADTIYQIVTKEDFKDFFKLVMKLFNQ